MHNNPVEEGLALKAEQYVYSSAIDYAGGKGLWHLVFYLYLYFVVLLSPRFSTIPSSRATFKSLLAVA